MISNTISNYNANKNKWNIKQKILTHYLINENRIVLKIEFCSLFDDKLLKHVYNVSIISNDRYFYILKLLIYNIYNI